MTPESKNKWSVIINIAITLLNAIAGYFSL